MGSDATALPASSATARPTLSEIAAVAYQLWLERGCPMGSDLEDWFRAEAMLENAGVVRREGLSGRPSTPCCDICTESEMAAEFLWDGHWEVWEREWVSARWVWDISASRLGVSNLARPYGRKP